jgi:LmbE family N-acetylglucosaminyl deacetylase
MDVRPFPAEWRRALVLVPHPDDPEYGVGAAVAKWTTQQVIDMTTPEVDGRRVAGFVLERSNDR